VITTYGFSIATTNKYLRQPAIDAVLKWLNEVHPLEKRTNTTPIKLRNSQNDPIFRLEVLEQDPDQAAARGTTITLMVQKKALDFDLRRTLQPTKAMVLPRRTIDRPEKRLAQLASEIVDLFKNHDASELVRPEIWIAKDEVDGQRLAAFAEAPSRRLPIVVETTIGKSQEITGAALAKELAGIAHVVQVRSNAAEVAFNEFYGARKISAGWVTVFWPGGIKPENFFQQDADELGKQLIAASVGALANLSLALSKKTVAQEQVPSKDLSHEVAELRRINLELLQEIAALEENVTLTDMLSAQKAEERDRAYDQLATFLSMDKDKSYLDKVSDAATHAQKNLTNLVFHSQAIESANNSNLMNGRRVYSNLVELNNLAARLQRGDIDPNVFNIYCNQDLSNFAASISDEAEHRYALDYAIAWKGENVLAKPHIRCGDARIHFYHDKATNEIVVAYIGRHLRDKTTN